MLKILVRAKKDAHAVRHAIKTILKDNTILVESLGGVRGDRICDKLAEKAEPLAIALLDRSAPRRCELSKPFVEIVYAKSSKIRNLTLQSIVSYITKGRAGLRLRYSWNRDSIILSADKGEHLVQQPLSPEGDSFILYTQGLHLLGKLTGLPVSAEHDDISLLFKTEEGIHILYGSKYPSLRVRFNRFRPKIEILYKNNVLTGFNINKFLNYNKDIIQILSNISINFIIKQNIRKAIVPLSGGKDSSAALVLATKALGPENVAAIYVDTGIDFDENLEHAKKVASRLGVDLLIEKADVDKGLLRERLPLPRASNRWCTGRKLLALRRGIKKLLNRGYDTLIVGDRDAESSKRSMRPPMRIDENIGLQILSPLKYWSGAHVEAFLHIHGVGVNTLYRMGFLRTGCYLCFALRPSWEIQVLLNTAYYSRLKKNKPDQARLIDRFLAAKLGGSEDGS